MEWSGVSDCSLDRFGRPASPSPRRASPSSLALALALVLPPPACAAPLLPRLSPPPLLLLSARVTMSTISSRDMLSKHAPGSPRGAGWCSGGSHRQKAWAPRLHIQCGLRNQVIHISSIPSTSFLFTDNDAAKQGGTDSDATRPADCDLQSSRRFVCVANRSLTSPLVSLVLLPFLSLQNAHRCCLPSCSAGRK